VDLAYHPSSISSVVVIFVLVEGWHCTSYFLEFDLVLAEGLEEFLEGGQHGLRCEAEPTQPVVSFSQRISPHFIVELVLNIVKGEHQPRLLAPEGLAGIEADTLLLRGFLPDAHEHGRFAIVAIVGLSEWECAVEGGEGVEVEDGQSIDEELQFIDVEWIG
jgi:hypothetical protein